MERDRECVCMREWGLGRGGMKEEPHQVTPRKYNYKEEGQVRRVWGSLLRCFTGGRHPQRQTLWRAPQEEAGNIHGVCQDEVVRLIGEGQRGNIKYRIGELGNCF